MLSIGEGMGEHDRISQIMMIIIKFNVGSILYMTESSISSVEQAYAHCRLLSFLYDLIVRTFEKTSIAAS